MLSFRKKILISYLGTLLLFFLLIFPFVEHLLESVVKNAMSQSDKLELASLISDFEYGYWRFGLIILVFFSLMSWMIIRHFTKPIQRIIDAIKPYQEGLVDHIPKISLEDLASPNEDFEQLAKTLNSLSGRIQEQIGALVREKSSYQLILQKGKAFIANASHELKTPITIIRGFAETLHDHPNLSKKIATEITDKIVRNCKRMDTLVKNLLTLASVEELPLSRLEECDINTIAGHCRSLILTIYPTATVNIIQAEKLHLTADPDLLERALMNLLDNAAKYSNGPAEIVVTISKEDKWAKVTVSDKGMGIPEEDLDHIFDRFYTVNKAHSRHLGGSGLGLSIVETIIEKHHGKISAQSTIGLGTTFILHLPLPLEEGAS